MNVQNIMTPDVISVSVDAAIEDAIKLMLKHQISGLPVVDRNRNLVGVISEGDLLRRIEIGTEPHHSRLLGFLMGPGRIAEEYVRCHGRKVSEIMTPEPITVTEATPVAEVARLIEKNRIKRLPVMRGDRLVGIVTRANLIRAVITRGASSPRTENDRKIRENICSQIDKESWAPAPLIGIDVRDGAVTLTGVVYDARQEDAMKVLAENTPGVKSVKNDLTWIEPVSGTAILPCDENEPKAAKC